MCDICKRSNCSNRCPNAIISNIGICEYCNENIEKGSCYVEFLNGMVHFECIGLMPIRKLLEIAEIDMKIA